MSDLIQRPMFDTDGRSLARSTDPETSSMSIPDAVSLAGWRQRISERALAVGVPQTANELAFAVTSNPTHRETARKRVGECKVLYKIGRRVCEITGKPASTYLHEVHATDQGV